LPRLFARAFGCRRPTGVLFAGAGDPAEWRGNDGGLDLVIFTMP
jgi:hypothetical protein